MNGEPINKDRRPCVGDLLWYMSLRMDEKGVANVSVDDIMREFQIDYFEAEELLNDITWPMGIGFAEKIGDNQYRVTDSGVKEIAFLKRFVPVAAKRAVDQSVAMKICVKLREWLKGIDSKSISCEDAWFVTRLNTSYFNWTDAEINAAWRMYQGDAQNDTQMIKGNEGC